MTMTPEKLAFIQGEATKSTPPTPAAVAEKPIVARTIDVELRQSEAPRESRTRSTRRASRGRSGQDQPEASDLLDQVLVPVTIRLQHRTAQALRRAYLEQRLKHAKPDTQQEIVEEAIGDWLSIHRYMD